MAITTYIPQAHNRAVRQASELPEEQNPERIPKESRTTDRDGNITQYTAYLPYGELLVDEHTSSEDMPYKFNGKELDEETGLYYYGARYMQPITSVWYGIDPSTEKYPDVSAYTYCMGNPVKFIDPDGEKVIPKTKNDLTIIKNTLPKNSHKYIQLDNYGCIDTKLMNKYSGNSENYKSLLLLAESEMDIFVSSESQTSYVKNNELYTESFNQVVIEEDFKDLEFKYQTGNITGETGNLGVTYMPTKGGDGKGPVGDNCIQININPTLSPIGAAETFSHEGYGHAYIYIESNGNRDAAIHHYENGSICTNMELKENSIKARKETIKNMFE